MQVVVFEVQRIDEVKTHQLYNSYQFGSFVIPVHFVVGWMSAWAAFCAKWGFRVEFRKLFFFFSRLSSLDVFENLRVRHVSSDGGMASSSTVTTRMFSCLIFASLATALLACCLIRRTTLAVKVHDLVRWRTRSCLKYWDSAGLYIFSSSISLVPLVKEALAVACFIAS